MCSAHENRRVSMKKKTWLRIIVGAASVSAGTVIVSAQNILVWVGAFLLFIGIVNLAAAVVDRETPPKL